MRAVVVSLLVLFLAPLAFAQELAASGGAMSVASTGDTSYAWSLEYRQGLFTHVAFSVAWFNEGHPTDHHRDGPAALLWYRHSFGDRFGLSLGYGAYRWFDTVRTASGGFENVHGTGGIGGVAATWDASKRVFLRFSLYRTHARDGIDTVLYLVGAGYRLWVPHDGTPPQAAPPPPQFTKATALELVAFGGRSIQNNFESQKTRAAGLEFRYGLAKYLDWTASFFDEGGGALQRNSLASQLWLVRAFSSRRIEVGLGAGVFYRLDNRVNETTTERLHDYDGLVTATIAGRFGPHFVTRLNWNRIATTNSRDKDVIVLGLGVQWGAPS